MGPADPALTVPPAPPYLDPDLGSIERPEEAGLHRRLVQRGGGGEAARAAQDNFDF